MKPCDSCPFAGHPEHFGMWRPAEYILTAYLGSLEDSPDAEFPEPMGCHKWGGGLRDPLRGTPQLCGGWTRAAPRALALRLARKTCRVDPADDEEVLTPVEMLRANGIDTDLLPPLAWSPSDARYPTFADWSEAVLDLRARLQEDPECAREYVIAGSPLDLRTMPIYPIQPKRKP